MVSKENIQFNFCKILASREVVLYDKHLPPKYHIHIKSFFIITMKDNKKSKLIITKKNPTGGMLFTNEISFWY